MKTFLRAGMKRETARLFSGLIVGFKLAMFIA